MNTQNYLPSICTKTICKLFSFLVRSYLYRSDVLHFSLLNVYRISHLIVLRYRLSAKFLWKRIPLTAKSAAAELEAIWKVGKAMRKKDYDSIYASLRFTWSPDISPLMQLVEGMNPLIFFYINHTPV